MKKILPFVLLVFLGIGQGATSLDGEYMGFRRVFEILFPDKENLTTEDMNVLAQQYLLRPKGEERLSPNTLIYYNDLFARFGADKKNKMDQLFKVFASLGMMSEVLPLSSFKSPNHVCILGSSIFSMSERLNFVISLVNKGLLDIKGAKIWFVVGDRDPLPQETKQVILDTAPFEKNPDWVFDGKLPLNEKEMADLVVKQMKIPEGMLGKIRIFSSPKIEGAKRSTTETTLRDFFASSDFDGGKILLISSNPFVSYQFAVARRAVFDVVKEKDFSLDDLGVSGSAPYWGTRIFEQDKMSDNDKTLSLGVLLDNLARLIYEQKIAKK
jgi:hypothetical protein